MYDVLCLLNLSNDVIFLFSLYKGHFIYTERQRERVSLSLWKLNFI